LIFRINRDTRFSKDETAYKDHLDLFVRFTPDFIGIGAGSHWIRQTSP